MAYGSDDFDELVGKTVQSVRLSPDKEYFFLVTEDAREYQYRVEGDCCSSSWIEHLSTPPQVEGAVITEVRDEGGEDVPSDEHECLTVYQTHFRTNRGDITLEYRNSSNGYYGGFLVFMGSHPAPANDNGTS